MRIYTVHGPRLASADARAVGDRVVLVRDGFHVWAFVFGGFWLLYHRLWWALLGYVVLVAGIGALLGGLRVSGSIDFCVMLLLALLIGLEASSLRRWRLSRGKWRQLDIVAGADEQEAERRFFERWFAGQSAAEDPMAVERGAPPPPRPVSRPPDIVGLFPQPGGSA
ncbi:MAG: DUF2628 domain-containing protein [Xanthobacteraceae bacterium]|nr:DUF2628 domain-containing protein [Xanthobacteraceae bacterium]